MQYLEFKNYFAPYIVFSTREIEKVFPDFNKMNLLSWQNKKYIIKLRNGWYKFAEKQHDEHMLFFISNKIYSPSYVSLETALSYYGLIPEASFLITCISSLKTNTFKNQLGTFNYSNVKSNLFFGYQNLMYNNHYFHMAEIEKTILDYFYLRNTIKTTEDIDSLRINKFVLREKLNLEKLSDYTSIYNSKVLMNKINMLKKYLDD